MNEIIFLTKEAPEGGYTAHALGHSVSVQAETEEEIHAKIQEVTESHFGSGREAKIAMGTQIRAASGNRNLIMEKRFCLAAKRDKPLNCIGGS